ncbi:hypothetical protein [Beijerinckia sp. L45]|uniref:hypothetical protein n=1 Tax=Beijerinckia sp. L45 TaxID=1641855 RepID=UPI00131B8F62|nr:hypothetical protein [Beijerinckia sp. L45]
MVIKHATLGAALLLTIPTIALAQSPAAPAAQSAGADHTTDTDDGGWFGSVKGMFGRGEDHSCATQAAVTNAAGDTVYVKRPNCP